jgi:prepilin-type N-terminal cleavage/methylation domain-containing protein
MINSLGQKYKHCSGMTLVEVIMALAVLAILLTVAIGSLSSISRSKRSLDDYQDVYLTSQSLLKRLTRELQLASCDLDSATKCSQGKGILLSPNEDAGAARPPLRSQRKKVGDLESSDITFLAMDAGQYMQETDSNQGLVQISYRLVKEKPEDTFYSLIREELPYILPAEEAYSQALVFPIAKNIIGLSFEFYDLISGEWSDEWGSANKSKSSLPSIIRCIITLQSQSGAIIDFQTSVAIRLAAQ